MPGPVGITVNGVNIVRPGVYVNINASAMVPSNPGPGGNVGIIGMSDGGIPGQVYTFTSFPQAQAVLRRGPALAALARIFNPTGDPTLAGASQAFWMRLAPAANPPAQSTLTAAGLTFTSMDYGRHTNGISLSIAAGTVFGTWTVTVAKPADGYQRSYVVGLALSVTSTTTTPQVVFDHVNKECDIYSNGVKVAQLPYPDTTTTVSNLAAFLNSLPGWTATITGDGSMPLQYMDNPPLSTTGSLSNALMDDDTVIGTTSTALYAAQGQLVYQMQADTQVSAALAAGPVNYGPLATVPQSPFTGGAGTSMDPSVASDYAPCLTLFETQDIQHLFLASSDAAVHALGYLHVLAMRTITRRRWRVLYAGGPVGQTPAQAIAQAQALGGPVCYAWNGTYYPDATTGLPVNAGGIGTAAQMCGMAAGTPEAVSLTNKMVIASALEVPAPSDDVVNALLVGGVCPIVYDPSFGSPIIVQALTTYQGGANVAFRKLQGLRIQDAIARGFKAILSSFVGGEIDLIEANRIKAKAAQFLDNSTVSANNPGGFLTQGSVNGKVTPAWTNLSVSSDGLQQWSIAVNASPVGEGAFLVVQVSLAPAQIEV